MAVCSTFINYPTEYILRSVEHGFDLKLTAEFGGQEQLTLIVFPAYWEGRMQVVGTCKGVSTTGLGFVERNNFARFHSMDSFLKGVGRQVRRELDSYLPRKLNYDSMLNIFVSPTTGRYLEGVDPRIVSEKLIGPVRGITDRGGKSWRSFALLMWYVS